MKVAIIQMDVILGRPESNLHKAEEMVRKASHENPDVMKLYEAFLGQPGGEVSHHLLHTHYTVRNRY